MSATIVHLDCIADTIEEIYWEEINEKDGVMRIIELCEDYLRAIEAEEKEIADLEEVELAAQEELEDGDI